MQQQSQIIENIRKLAKEEINAPWSQAYESVIRDAIQGTERTFPHHLVFRAGDERAIEIKTEIPWKLLKCLVSHPEIKGHIHPSGVRLSNAHITTDRMDDNVPIYDFFLCESSVPLLLTKCLFDGRLQFDYCKFKALGFVDSTIPSVHLRAAEVEGGVTFEGCFFNKAGELSIKAHEAKVGGTLCLRKCVAVGGVRLLGVDIGGDLDATGALLVSTQFGEHFWGKGTTVESYWGEGLRKFYTLFDVFDERKRTLEQILKDMRDAVHNVSEPSVQKAGCSQSCNNTASGATQELTYNVSEPWFKSLDLSNALIRRHVKLRRRFRALGEVSLNSADIGGAVLIRGAFFFQPDGVALSMDALQIKKDLYIQEDDDTTPGEKKRSIVHGSVSMRGAEVFHRFVCDRVVFRFYRSAQDVEDLRSTPMREREVYALFAKRLHVGGDLMLNRDEKRGDKAVEIPSGVLDSLVSLENARIGGRLFLRGKPNVEKTELPFLSLAFADIKGSAELKIIPDCDSCDVSLFSASAGRIDISGSDFDKVKWDMDNLVYKAVEYRTCKSDKDTTGKACKTGVDAWLDKVLSTAIQPYDKFMAFLKESGDEQGAWVVGMAKENQITRSIGIGPRKLLEQVRSGALSEKLWKWVLPGFLYYMWRRILGVTVRYGYSPIPAIWYLIALCVFGGVVFAWAHSTYYIFPKKAVYYTGKAHADVGNLHVGNVNIGVCKKNGEGCLAPDGYPVFNPWVYSLELATPLPELGQEEHWEVRGDGGLGFIFLVYKWLHTAFGWLLSILIVLSPTKLLRRD